MQNVIHFLTANWDGILGILVAFLALGEAIVRAFPTVDQSGFVTRFGKLLDFLLKNVPNNVKKPEAPAQVKEASGEPGEPPKSA